jgi:hypothetical protein
MNRHPKERIMKLIAYRHRMAAVVAVLAFPVLTGAAKEGGCQGGGVIPIGGNAGHDGGIDYCVCTGEPPAGETKVCPDDSEAGPVCMTHADDTCAWEVRTCPADGGISVVTDGAIADRTVGDSTLVDTAVDDGGCHCLGVDLRFGAKGGNGPQDDTSTLTPCATFAHQRDYRFPAQTSVSCVQQLDTCDSRNIGPDAIASALANPDVRVAIALAPILYGYDPRPLDGTVYEIQVGTAIIDVGEECIGRTDCPVSIPPSLRALVNLLTNLDAQELARGQCKDVYNP